MALLLVDEEPRLTFFVDRLFVDFFTRVLDCFRDVGAGLTLFRFSRVAGFTREFLIGDLGVTRDFELLRFDFTPARVFRGDVVAGFDTARFARRLGVRVCGERVVTGRRTDDGVGLSTRPFLSTLFFTLRSVDFTLAGAVVRRARLVASGRRTLSRLGATRCAAGLEETRVFEDRLALAEEDARSERSPERRAASRRSRAARVARVSTVLLRCMFDLTFLLQLVLLAYLAFFLYFFEEPLA